MATKATNKPKADKATTAKATKAKAKQSAFNDEQAEAIREVVNDFLTNDQFNVSLPADDVIESCRIALCDEDIMANIVSAVVAELAKAKPAKVTA